MSLDQKLYEDIKYPNQGKCSDCFEGKQCHLHSFDNVKLGSADSDEESLQSNNIFGSEKSVTSDTSKLNTENVSRKEDFHAAKSSTSKDISEVSPFKQAVKGFVLKKLSSKKVSQSPILSGITGKIVKKLEDGKEHPTAVTKNDQLAVSYDNTKDDLQTCELKSVVANDLVDGVEEASECFEEQEKDTSNIDFPPDSPLSMSLPASPAHKMEKQSRSCSYEDLQKAPFDIPSLSASKDNTRSSSNDIELQDMSNETNFELTDPIYSDHFELNCYPNNIYCGIEEEKISLKETVWKCFDMFCYLKYIFSLPLSHFFLFFSIVIHNSELLSRCLGLVFDSLIIGYIIYNYFCILLQVSLEKIVTSSTSSSSSASYSENTSTAVKTKKSGDTILKGRVKVLKGDYDPDIVKRHRTDTVDICIENCCIKLSYQKKSMDEPQFCFVYDISDAKISIVPKTLKRKKIWKKHYPICILMSPVAKSYEDVNDSEELRATDYLSLVTYEDALVETIKQRALYLFASSDREKQSLFWALYHNLKACDLSSINQSVLACETHQKTSLTNLSYTALVENIDNKNASFAEDSQEEEQNFIRSGHPLNFSNYMEMLFENCRKRSKLNRSRSVEDILISKEDFSKSSGATLPKEFMYCDYYPVDWLNIVIGRLFYDFLTKRHWAEDVKARIQRKLDKIEMPNFIESLRVNEVILGECLPVLHSVTQPVEDSYGVWLNFDFEYNGTFQMTIETKLKITTPNYGATTDQLESPNGKQSLNLSDSSDEDGSEKGQGSPKKSKILNKIEKWISHRHFATVAQSRIVKRYVGDLTNMPLTLTVEVSSLNGILIVNLPPEPSDRIWYGFQKDPDLTLNVFPKVGKLEINLSAVVLTIQKKLIQEFKKALVMPNMDDLIIPIMYAPTLVQ